jgi:hypothetical protein
MAAQKSASGADDLWSKLPGDLLGEVYAWIAAPLHRVRFAAVCTSWRAVASWQPRQPAVPWLALSMESPEQAFCPVDGAVLRVPFPTGTVLVGCYHGGWIAATSEVDAADRGAASLVIVNPFSGVEVPLSEKQRAVQRIWKLAFSEAPTSKHCILAATTYGLALCRVGCRSHPWRILEKCENYHDIVFGSNGKKLYGLHCDSVYVHDIHMAKDGTPMASAACEVRTDQRPIGSEFSRTYLVDYKDTLLMVIRVSSWSSSTEPTYIFKVFQLVKAENNACYDYMWTEVATLDDHALFLSMKCCKAVRVPASDGRSGVERNHIYYNYANVLGEDDSTLYDAQLTWGRVNNNLHCMKNKIGNGADRILSTGYYVTSSPCYGLTWILPPDF